MFQKKPQFKEVGSLSRMGKALGHPERDTIKHFRTFPALQIREGTNDEFVDEMGGPEALAEHQHGPWKPEKR